MIDFIDPDDLPMPIEHESSDEWESDKDGKTYYPNNKSERWNLEREMRK